MTDEEKSEITKEYLNNTFKQTEANQLAIMIGQKCFYEGLEKGLAEGEPKWHDLRKDPNDLPKESGEYWCKLKEERRYAFEIYYIDSLFYKSRWEELDIIAWTELPRFES